VLLVFTLVSFITGSALPEDVASYRIQYQEPGTDRIRVGILFPKLPDGPKVLVIPRAIPMGYGEQHFDRYVDRVRAFTPGGDAIAVTRQDGPRWLLGESETSVSRVEYEVDITRMEREIYSAADTSKVRSRYLSLLGYSILAYLEGFKNLPAHLSIEVPEDWPVMTTLAPRAPPPRGKTEGNAPNFYALADSQMMAGPDLEVRRLECEAPLFMALYAEGNVDVAIMAEIAEKAMAQVIRYFGNVPFPHYTIHQELLRPISERHSYGFSMEHLDSATFYLSDDRGITSRSQEQQISRTHYNFAHHFAHAWIPKRSYSKGYFPFTWELAPVLDTIWFSEGFPQYAAIEAVADSLPEDEGRRYRDSMLEGRFRGNIRNAPLFIRELSTVELSRVASTRYSEDFRTGRNVFSRGGLMAAEMDELIRKKSRGSKRLRDGLRHLMNWSAKNQRPFTIEEIPDIFEEATGVSTHPVMERWLAPQIK
jgi:predicted metalloprotease with PDZ domain